MFKNQRGGAAVEFAIVLPLLALILFGTIDFALLFYNKQVITNASREGARSAIVANNWGVQYVGGVLNISDKTTFKNIVDDYCKSRLINLGNPAGESDSIDLSDIDDLDDPGVDVSHSGNYITVTAKYEYSHLFSGITKFNKTMLTGQTVMRQEWL